MGYELKDVSRIQGIVTRSRGSERKARQLAQQMADAITDVSKARRRAFAATALKMHDLAAIFYIRYGQLSATYPNGWVR